MCHNPGTFFRLNKFGHGTISLFFLDLGNPAIPLDSSPNSMGLSYIRTISPSLAPSLPSSKMNAGIRVECALATRTPKPTSSGNWES